MSPLNRSGAAATHIKKRLVEKEQNAAHMQIAADASYFVISVLAMTHIGENASQTKRVFASSKI